jgi:hypothetical protein
MGSQFVPCKSEAGVFSFPEEIRGWAGWQNFPIWSMQVDESRIIVAVAGLIPEAVAQSAVSSMIQSIIQSAIRLTPFGNAFVTNAVER